MALLFPMLLSLVVVGCGGASGPAAVKLSLTAPTDGATVVVSSLYALGTVQPKGAAVVISGKPVHVHSGAFRDRISLHRGLNRLRLVASAPGFLTTTMNVAVRSEPTPQRPAGGQSSAAQTSRHSVNAPPGTRYAPAVQAEFLRTCEAAAYRNPRARESCGCALRYLEEHVAQTTLASAERAIFNGESTVPRWLRDAARACRG
jgi:hypothetical protein